MLVVPVLLAGLGVQRIDMVERGRDVHDAVDDDRRRLQRLLHFRLEDPGGVKLADIGGVDLLAREISGLIVIAVGMKKVVPVASRGVELILRYRGCGCPFRLRPGRRQTPRQAQHQRASKRASHFPTRHCSSLTWSRFDRFSAAPFGFHAIETARGLAICQ